MPATWRNVDRFTATSAVALAAFGLFAPAALGDNSGSNPPVFFMQWDASADGLAPNTYNPANFGSLEFGTWVLGSNDPSQPGGALREQTGWRYQGGLENAAWTMSWDCVVNEDPFVDATINVTNNSNVVQTFWVYMPLAINPAIPGGTIMNGSVSAVLSANTFDGATLTSNPGFAVYEAFIDGSSVASMWNPYALAAIPFGSANDNNQFNNAAGPAANTEIAIRLRFDLSPGDSASVTGIFEIQPIPAPAGLAVLALIGVCGSRRRR
jgi:hypothetical protein